MQTFVNYIIRFRWFIAITIPLLTIFISMQLRYLEFEGSYRIWFAEDSKALQNYDQFRAVFGNDDAVSIIFKDENGIMNPKALHVIQRITEKLWETKYIARVNSLTNYQYIHSNEDAPDDVIVEDFIDDIDALSPEDLKEKERIALGEDQLIGSIIGADLKTTIIAGRLTPKSIDVKSSAKEIHAAVLKIIEDEKGSQYNFRLSGGPILNMTFVALGVHDATTYTPIIIVLVMLMLWLIFRSASGMFLSISVVVFTFLIALSIQVLLGYKINNFTANLPLFVIAIGIADAMHLFWIYLLGRRKRLSNEEAIFYSVNKNFLPILLTTLTTAVGFASLGISAVVPIKTLGVATASASLLAFFFTILFVPAVLAIIKPKIKAKDDSTSEDLFSPNGFSHKYARFIVRYNLPIIIASVFVFGSMGLGLMHLEVDSNTVRYFKEDVHYRQTAHFTQDNITGPMAYELVIDSKNVDGIKSPDFLRAVEKFSAAYKKQYSDIRHVTSLLDIVKKYNEVLNHSKTIPDSQNLVAQYLLLYTLSLPQGMEINDMMDVDERYLRLTAKVNIVNTSLDLEMMQWAEDWWEQTPYTAKINGKVAMFANMQKDVTATLIESITLAILTVSFMMLIIFRSIRMIPFFIIPNVLPIVLVIGIMGWLGITIDIGAAISGAIIIGVAVDDTIHFLVKYSEARKKGYDFEKSLAYVMQYAGSAIVFTTVILSSAFMMFTFSQFLPNVHFGVITTIALCIAVLVDLLLLPALLCRYDGKKQSTLV